MIAVDTNILVYAHREELAKHEPAKRRLKQLVEGAELWALPVFCLTEFIRVISHPRLFDPPHSPMEAVQAVQRFAASPSLRVLMPGERFLPLFYSAIEHAQAKGNLVFDAQIVALCREHGVRTLLTEDRDFARFQGFDTEQLGV